MSDSTPSHDVTSGDPRSLTARLFVIPEELDFANSCLIVLFLLCLGLQLIYLMLPTALKRLVERLDFNKDKHSFSYTGGAAAFLLVGAGVM